MIYSLQGKVTLRHAHDIIITIQGISYQVLVAKPESFPLQQEVIVYTHQVFREDDQYLVGFASLLEKDVFLQLVSVKGIGPKTALGMLTKAEPSALISAINQGEVTFLRSLPGIGPKAASQIILDLKGKLISEDGIAKPSVFPPFLEAKDALKNLGFKTSEIDHVLKQLPQDETKAEVIIRSALKMLGKVS
jgi:Holliday junction DNA helicase RuvA